MRVHTPARDSPTEGWIVAGIVDGREAYPGLAQDVAGMPYVLRLACDMAGAGVRRIVVLWNGTAPPTLDSCAQDPRLGGATLELVSTPPAGDRRDPILLVRADRLYHRDIPKQVASAWRTTAAPIARLEGHEHDAVLITDRARAEAIFAAAPQAGGIEHALAGCEVGTAAPPYLGFTTATPDRKALRRAERRLVWSMRKQADGLASKFINRHLSLPITWLVMRTPIRPNHVTVFCFALAVAGGLALARGGYLAGVIGMMLVNLGSIIDGVDGELARLKYRYSRLGQWMDTLADDFGNVAYIAGIALNLAPGVTWAVPLASVALGCFAITQITQYTLITRVYKSGDLAAIPWAFQSHDFLTQRQPGVIAWIKLTVPKMLKRDFALTMFVGFAMIGRLDLILVVFSAGAITFFGVFAVQLVRNLGSVRRQASGPA